MLLNNRAVSDGNSVKTTQNFGYKNIVQSIFKAFTSLLFIKSIKEVLPF